MNIRTLNRVQLRPSENVASFDVDCQYTFTPACPDEIPVPGGDTIVPELNAQSQFANFRLGSKDAHSPKAYWVANEKHPPFSKGNEGTIDTYWPVHAIPGTRGFELMDGLPSVTEYDYFVWKGIELNLHPYGACYHDPEKRMSTGVVEFLTAKHVQIVIVGGLATDYCVKHTVLELLQAGFDVIVNLAAVRGVARDTTGHACESMARNGAQFIDSAASLLPSSG